MNKTVLKLEGVGKKYNIGLKKNESLGEIIKNFSLLKKKENAEVKEFWALKDITFDIKQGDAVGIIGKNGAGKSTLLKILSRITEPTKGRIEINGRISSLLEVGTGFHPELSGRENIFLNGTILGMKRAEIKQKFDEIVEFSGVEKFLDTPVKHYSSGMYVRLAFAVAAHLEPEILIIDEVLAVGDIEFQNKCLGKMQDVTQQGRTVLFVSHNMAAINKFCKQGLLLDKGEMVAFSDVKNILDMYMQEGVKSAKNFMKTLPISNEEHQISVTAFKAFVDEENNLIITIDITSKIKNTGIGIGISIDSFEGVNISKISPSVTNLVIDIEGNKTLVLKCLNIQSMLAGGDYIIGFWLSKVKKEILIKVDEAMILQIPPIDHYNSGAVWTYAKNGFIPLQFNLKQPDNLLL